MNSRPAKVLRCLDYNKQDNCAHPGNLRRPLHTTSYEASPPQYWASKSSKVSSKMRSQIHSASKVTFYDLPGEIRNWIYEYYFGIHGEKLKPLKPRYEEPKDRKVPFNILLASRQVHAEAESMMYHRYLPHFRKIFNSSSDHSEDADPSGRLLSFLARMAPRYQDRFIISLVYVGLCDDECGKILDRMQIRDSSLWDWYNLRWWNSSASLTSSRFFIPYSKKNLPPEIGYIRISKNFDNAPGTSWIAFHGYLGKVLEFKGGVRQVTLEVARGYRYPLEQVMLH